MLFAQKWFVAKYRHQQAINFLNRKYEHNFLHSSSSFHLFLSHPFTVNANDGWWKMKWIFFFDFCKRNYMLLLLLLIMKSSSYLTLSHFIGKLLEKLYFKRSAVSLMRSALIFIQSFKIADILIEKWNIDFIRCFFFVPLDWAKSRRD